MKNLEGKNGALIAGIKEENDIIKQEIAPELETLREAKSLLEFQLVEAKSALEDKSEKLTNCLKTIEVLQSNIVLTSYF